MENNHPTKTRSLTYMGRRANRTQVGSQGNGPRVVITEWVDDQAPHANTPKPHKAGDVKATHMTGDDRKNTLVVHTSSQFDSVADAVVWAERRLS